MKILFSSALIAGLAAVSFAADTNVALGKSVIASSGYYNAGSEVFETPNIVDGNVGDTGTGYDWSFWLTPQGQNTGYATVDLGGLFTLSSFDLQDTHNRGHYDRGTKDYHIDLSTDGVNFTTAVTDSFTQSEWSNLTWKTNTLTTPVTARYVKFVIDSGYGGASAGINELRAMGHEAVPEPASMAALALGALGLLKRRRR
ncbi:discoidin domain-containing protein [bacterium]|nr:MAG: discoidin domain-containing protein [bacterium]